MLCTYKIAKTRLPLQSEFYKAYQQLYSSSHSMHKKFGPEHSKDSQHAYTIQDMEVAEHNCTDTFNAKIII
jgi:hypothetical protein